MLKPVRPLTLFFPGSSSFPIKMLATDVKTQNILPDPNLFIFLSWMKVSEAECKRDWHKVRLYLFFNMRKFWTRISDSVCKDLKSSFCVHTQHHSGNLLVMLQLLIPVNCWNEFTVSFFWKGNLLVIYQWSLTVWKGLVSLRLAVFVVVVFLLCFSLPLLLNLSLSAFISVFDSLCLSLPVAFCQLWLSLLFHIS